MYTGKLG
ncbi:uncharacterized protein FFM5_15307 [Fusarium fujikuroi]|nr:uncharacterized protein FFM5_15307 [Fusarium fujikuroi]